MISIWEINDPGEEAGSPGGVVARRGQASEKGTLERDTAVVSQRGVWALGVTLQDKGTGSKPSDLDQARPDFSDERRLAFPHSLSTKDVPHEFSRRGSRDTRP